MKTRDNKKGEKIIKIVFECNREGIGFRELSKKSGISRGGLDWWIKFLKSMGYINNSLPIRLTPSAIKKLQLRSLSLPEDKRSKKYANSISIKNRVEKNHKDKFRKQKIILLILSKAVFGSSIFYKTHDPIPGDMSIYDPVNLKKRFTYSNITLPGVGIDDVSYKFGSRASDMPNKKAYFPENRINVDNNQIFGYLRISKKEAQKYLNFLVDNKTPILKPMSKEDFINSLIDYGSSNPLHINLKQDYLIFERYLEKRLKFDFKSFQLIKQSYQNKIRYTLIDPLLKEFILNFILLYNSQIQPLLEYEYIQGNLKKDQINIYKKWLKNLYGINNKLFEIIEIIQKFKRNQLQLILKEKNKEKNDKRIINRHYIVIYNNSIFENNLNKLSKKYTSLNVKYPDIMDTFKLLFPDSIKKMINQLYKIRKNKILSGKY